MEEIVKELINQICCKNVQHSNFYGKKTFKKVCGKTATHTNGQHYFCRHHAKAGRYILRVGDIGEILARFDTEQEMRNNKHLFPEARMQKLSKSHRKDIY
jgi:hypothetical protein